MNTTAYKKPNPYIEKFKSSLLTDRPAMEAIRNTMSDAKYGELWWVSATTVIKYMWYVKKWLYNGMPQIKLDVEATNKLRLQYSDWKLAKMLNCSNASIAKYCWTRRSRWIPYSTKIHIVPDIVPDMQPAIVHKKKKLQVELKQDRWEYPVEIPYWANDSIYISWDNPHPYLFSKIS